MRLLLAEDDASLRSVLERGLRENGYVVDAVGDGEAALMWLHGSDYEAVILDWRMPKLSGLGVVQEARRLGKRTPIIMLTARDAPTDRVAGLRQGADDYLVKPFHFDELLARIDALQRRPALTLAPKMQLGDLSLDPAAREIAIAGHAVALTATEIRIVELLLRRSPSVVTRQMIAVQVWNEEADAAGSNTIDVHIGRLRTKLVRSTAHIQTVRGTGYKLVGP